MEIKIGIRQSNRELTLDTELSIDEVEKAISTAISNDSVLTLADKKGRTVMVPAGALAYVETGAEVQHRVGFGIA